ncbi:hypothetical protein H0A36_06165 [Endozoicomonas sp. SM1973]|uniref:Uncharacterized protein n=1 Tax=Spartinivicinus marinus TaxID=2994442 RepID=A0A853HV00_9GAMM|nr:hypothetical protein [Spartinivicinus marinus]MCX4028255.1 hypothetical protein [Spartinivicinus marinus]NYZ65590.1 hypothetical protein [Spartinivicinus marinus]
MKFEVRNEAWLLQDKQWMRARKEQWKYLEKKVKKTDAFNRKQRGYLKDYFLKGIRPEYDYIDNPMPIPLLFMLWFHPDHSEACWDKIIKYIWKMPDDIIYEHYRFSIDIFRKNAGSPFDYFPEEGFSDGFMGGLEERIFILLFGEKFKTHIYISNKWQLNFEDIQLYPARWFYQIIWLNKSINKTNPTVYWQYDHAVNACIEHLQNEDIKAFLGLHKPGFSERKERAKTRFYEYLNVLASDNYPEGEFRKRYIQKMRAKLDEGNIPPLLDELWQKAKKGELAID